MLPSENYPLFSELNLSELHIKSTLRVFSELTNTGRNWANSNINLGVQTGIDVWQFIYVEKL